MLAMKLTISDQREDIDVDYVYTFLKTQTAWQAGIGQKTFMRLIENSLCFSAYEEDRQVGFVRTTTDYATFAWIDDLFVDPEYRGRGIGRELALTLTKHPSLSSVAIWVLSSNNQYSRQIFEQLGFARFSEERVESWMARPKDKPEAYRG